jgi:hypothetical protein
MEGHLKDLVILLLHPRVFRFGFFEDGDVGVGVFPLAKKIPVRGPKGRLDRADRRGRVFPVVAAADCLVRKARRLPTTRVLAMNCLC